MRYSTSLVAASLATSTLGAVIEVVAGPGNVFVPDSVTANEGDYVSFVFNPTHNVGSSSFDQPCIRNETFGFWSGTFDFSNGEAAERFVVRVNNTEPVWFYCQVSGHCMDGMVGVINPPPEDGVTTLTQYRNAATRQSRATPPSDFPVTGGQRLDAEGVRQLEQESGGGSPSSSPSGAPGTIRTSPTPSTAETTSSPAETSTAQESSGGVVTSAETSAAESTGSQPSATGGAPAESASPSPGAAASNVVGSSGVLAFAAGLAAWFL